MMFAHLHSIHPKVPKEHDRKILATNEYVKFVENQNSVNDYSENKTIQFFKLFPEFEAVVRHNELTASENYQMLHKLCKLSLLANLPSEEKIILLEKANIFFNSYLGNIAQACRNVAIDICGNIFTNTNQKRVESFRKVWDNH